MTASLSVKDVSKTYHTQAQPVEVLKGASFDMSETDALAITGPSGSGKSTLLHIIGALDPPTSGRVVLNNKNPYELDDIQLARFRNQSVGFVFQDHHLLPQYSVLENVLLPTFAFPKTGPEAEQRARMLLDRVGLAHRLNHRPGELSGGERQRVAIARSLINAPSLLLCDEPTGNLDQATAKTVADLLFELHDEVSNMLIVVTHSQKLANRFGRRLAVEGGVSREVK